MKLLTYTTIFLTLVGAGVIETKYGCDTQIAKLDAPTQSGMLGYPLSYSETGQVMSSAFINGKPRSFLHDHIDDLDTLPGAKTSPVAEPIVRHSSPATKMSQSSSNRTVIHSSSNVCRNNNAYTPAYGQTWHCQPRHPIQVFYGRCR